MDIDFTDPDAILEDKNKKVKELKKILRKLKDNREKEKKGFLARFFRRIKKGSIVWR